MRRSLASHAAQLPGSQNPWEIHAAIDTHLLLLREMAAVPTPDQPRSTNLLKRLVSPPLVFSW
jgi:hypothetical protein